MDIGCTEPLLSTHDNTSFIQNFDELTSHSPPLCGIDNFAVGYPGHLQFPELYSSPAYTAVNNGDSTSRGVFEVPATVMRPRDLVHAPIESVNVFQHAGQVVDNPTTALDSLLGAEAATSPTYSIGPAIPINTFQPDASANYDYQRLPISTGPEIPNLVAISNSPRTHASQAKPDDGRILCDFCTGSFGRGSDYRRHLRRHSNKNRPCPVDGCPRKHYRRDKLKKHLIDGHKLDSARVDELCSAWECGSRGSA